MIIVTGALGFIGFNLVKKLNVSNKKDIILVDYNKKTNPIKLLKFKKFISVENFYKNLEKNIPKNTKFIFHQGANSSTTEKNKKKIFKQNYYYSLKLINYCQKNKIKLIYASSAATYGIKNKKFVENNWKLKPGNYYAQSKYLIDKYVRNILKKEGHTQIVGLRYFNVYGPFEFHKKNMGSVMMNFNYQYKKNGIINVFKGSNGYGNGEHVRDFIHVDNCIDVNMYFFKNNISGIFNVGTGTKNSFNKVAHSIFKFYKKKSIQINYIDFPKSLIGKYQSYTKANVNKLRKNGFKKKFIELEKGIFKYLKFLNKSQLKK
jgi:ADP-L-glycero-D-manno-heptose 6-epimerase